MENSLTVPGKLEQPHSAAQPLNVRSLENTKVNQLVKRPRVVVAHCQDTSKAASDEGSHAMLSR